jgi:hypothetical protein
MKQPNENLTAQFEKNARPTPPAPARDFERIANANALPSQGYVKSFNDATQRGRGQIAADAGRRGIESFPPAKQMLDGNK